MTTTLEARGVRKAFGGVLALNDVSIDVRERSVTGLIGPNGSGKTTLLDCLSGFTAPDAGEVLLAGRDITSAPPHRRARAGLSRTFQHVRIYASLTVREHLLLAAQEFDDAGWLHALAGTARVRDAEQRATLRGRELLELVGLEAFETAPAETLSFGQRKLLALAQSLMSSPAIVLLDEPLAGVSPVMVDTLVEAVRRLNAHGHTFLIVEHNIEFVRRACGWVIVLDNGVRLVEGPPAKVWEDERVLDSFLGEAFE